VACPIRVPTDAPAPLGSGLDGIRWSTTAGKWQVQWFSLAGVVAQARSVLPEGVFELARMSI